MNPESTEPHEPTESAEPLQYAPVGAGACRGAPISPKALLCASVVCGAVSLVVGLAALVTNPCLFVIVGEGTALAALILAAIAALRNADARLVPSDRQRGGRVWGTVIVGAVMVAVQTLLSLGALSRTREVAKAAVSAANLRGIGRALAVYANDRGEWPAALDDLVAAGDVSPQMLVTIHDALGRPIAPGPPYYSSFAYRGGGTSTSQDPTVILAFERAPMTVMDARLWPKRGRLVLFGDGRVATLDEPAFQAALTKDEERRRELGLAVPARP
jgi:hypothetical protein